MLKLSRKSSIRVKKILLSLSTPIAIETSTKKNI